MKLRNKKIMAVLMATTLVTGAFAVSASNLTKNVQLRYNNINVKVDGEQKMPKQEPFFIGDSVYVSLRDAGELIGSYVNWNGSTNTVEINTSGLSGSALSQELAAKNHQLALAKAEIEKMQDKIETYEKELGITDSEENQEDEENVTTTLIEKTLEKIEDRYEDQYDVDWEFRLEGNEEQLEFQMRYDSEESGKAFKAISKTSLEKFTRDILKDIQKECGSIEIVGKIYDSEEKETKAEFKMSKKGSFNFKVIQSSNFDEEDLKDFAETLKESYKNFPSLNFGGAFDASSIKVRDIILTENDDEIEFEIYTDYANLSSAKRAWKDMDGAAKDKIERYLQNIQDEIEEEFEADVIGYILNEDKEIIAHYDDRLRLN